MVKDKALHPFDLKSQTTKTNNEKT